MNIENPSEVSQIIQFIYLSVAVLYTYHAFSNLNYLKTNDKKGIMLNVAMCLGAAGYALSFLFFLHLKNPVFNSFIYHSTYISAMISFLAYLNLIKIFFNLDARFFNFLNICYPLGIAFVFADAVALFFFDASLIAAELDATPKTLIGIVGEASVKMSPFARAFYSLTYGSILICAGFVLVYFIKHQRQEKVLILGLAISIIAGIHDSLVSLSYIFYSVPMIYLGYALECIWFTRFFQQQSILKLDSIQNELNKMSKVAYVGQIAGSIFHDIRNPLSVLNLRIHRLEALFKKTSEATESANPLWEKSALEAQKQLKSMDRCVNTIDNIIKSYMNIIHHKEAASLSKENLHHIVMDAIELASDRLTKIKSDVQVEIAKDLEFECEASDLTLVITNLINNSCDAIGGLQEQWIKVFYQDGCIYIQDSGGGIEPQIREKIFAMQFTTKDKGKGTGLGLGITREILHKMKLNIVYDSGYSNTTFRIEKIGKS